ncbi:CDP-glycerol glycerophosphotransferase family protein [Rossellomorea marisflavi]|uniref:CDP-glycerol glycerophosphotransferase family protein n=1 Tax=Rossellomorea marisflavi TaxID=189381 RepID=UPI001EE2020E|nr:CDP-glycerol glycerophosphotransferase family protein [Rossellomorea marisflavi]UKS65014.1 CDP-glycerol glycerophosphotransferase family protein [Rossellomorea marisflavi]
METDIQKHKTDELKELLMIEQNHDTYTYQGHLSDERFCVISLVTKPRSQAKNLSKLTDNHSEKPGTFHFPFTFEEFLEKTNYEYQDSTETYDLFLQVLVKSDVLNEKKYKKLRKHAVEEEHHSILQLRMGNFNKTKRLRDTSLTYKDQTLANYVTVKGNVSLLLNKDIPLSCKPQIHELSSSKGALTIRGHLYSANAYIEHSQLLLSGRNSEKSFESSVTINWSDLTEEHFGLYTFTFESTVHFEAINDGDILPQDTFDLHLINTYSGIKEPNLVRLGKPIKELHDAIPDTHHFHGTKVGVISPFYTFKGSNLSFDVIKFNRFTYEYLEYKLSKSRETDKDIWIIGERPYKAQDNGYFFFKYMRENYPKKKVYYVIEKDSPDLDKVKELGNILYFKSRKHIKYMLMADVILCTHHADFLYPIRSQRFKNAVAAKKVFLQHGILGTKNILANYGKDAHSFETDLFLVSSEFEKKIVVNDFNYLPAEVKVTGLSRFDSLLNPDVPPKNQLLIIPTWRNWLSEKETFVKSEYYSRYLALLQSEELRTFSKKYSMEILFCLHPNMQQYTNLFEQDGVTIVHQGDRDVQVLMKESKLMITDYSSVGFDFSFLDKPVIYYQFDREKFLGKDPSHLNLDQDLPGSIVLNQEDLFETLSLYGKSHFAISEESKKRAEKFLTYRDRHTNERILKAVSSLTSS